MKKVIREKRILKSLMDISAFLNFVENPELILSLIIEECVLLTRAEWGVLLSYDARFNLDSFQITKALTDREKSHLSSLLDNSVKDIIHKKGYEAILDEALWERREIRGLFRQALGKKISSILISPLKKKRFLGLCLVINKKKHDAFTKIDKENFSIICQEASIVLENIDLLKSKLQNERMAAIGQTMAGLSHYIKNILQGIFAGSYLVNTGIKEDRITTIKDAWTVVDKNIKRISDLVMDMLYYSKERKVVKEKIDPRILIEDTLELIRPRLKERDIKLRIFIKDLPRYITVNEKGIHRSILDIITNAIDACDKKESFIEFRAMHDITSETLKIIISDNGRGMSQEDKDRAFLPFYTAKKEEGTGLGLAITKKIIEEHGGSIRFESELSKGTTFEISLPARSGGS